LERCPTGIRIGVRQPCEYAQLERVKKQTGIEDVTFQYFRHWFISHCVMAGIDYKTIAYWVSHRDGGVLIGRLYGHLDKEHPSKMAKKLSLHFS
jgi:integrase